jgi:hypothetical protein
MGQTEKWTIIGNEPQNPISADGRLSHCTISFVNKIVTILVPTVLCVLNLLWTWNYCCKLEIVCADGSTLVVTMP